MFRAIEEGLELRVSEARERASEHGNQETWLTDEQTNQNSNHSISSVATFNDADAMHSLHTRRIRQSWVGTCLPTEMITTFSIQALQSI